MSANYVWLNDLDQCFLAAGVPFIEVGPSGADATGSPDWRSRGRPLSTGSFAPTGVLCHHTASPSGTSPLSDLNVILAGNTQAPGPIAQLFIGRDAQLYIVAAGRANHGGKGKRPGIDSSCADMNAHLLGIEVSNNGVGEWWPEVQTDLYARTVAALCAWYGWGTEAVYLHATTGPPSGGCNSKIDPAGPWAREPGLVGSTPWDLAGWRAYVSEVMTVPEAPPSWVGIPEESDMPNRVGPLFIQATGADGTPPGTVFFLDGRGISLRRMEDEAQLNDVRWQLDEAGYPHDAVHGPIVPVDKVRSYGLPLN
jgi:hypothetical protein